MNCNLTASAMYCIPKPAKSRFNRKLPCIIRKHSGKPSGSGCSGSMWNFSLIGGQIWAARKASTWPHGYHEWRLCGRSFPCKLWDAGEKGLTLSVFEWDSRSKIMLYGQKDYAYGERLTKPDFCEGNPIRLYSLPEIRRIFGTLGMEVIDAYSDFPACLFRTTAFS